MTATGPLRERAVALARALDRWPRLKSAGNTLIAAGFAIGAIWLASLWNPFYVDSTRLEPLHTAESRSLIETRPSVNGGELVEGGSVRQFVLLRRDDSPPETAVERSLCVRPVLMFDLLAAADASVGETLMSVQAGDLSVTRRITKATGIEPLCLAVPDAAAFPAALVVRLDGGRTERPASWFAAEGAEPGEAMLLARAFTEEPGPSSLTSPGPGPLALTITSNWTRTHEMKPRPARDRLVDVLILVSPLVIAVVAVIALFADPASRRRSTAQWVLRGSAGSLLAGMLVLTVATTTIAARGGPVAPVTAGTWLDQQVTAGELVDGSAIEQPVERRLLPSERPAGQDRLCAEVLLATFLDRDNGGTLTYRLSDGSTDVTATIDASTVTDNTWTAGCFDASAGALLDGRELTLAVEGVGGIPGRSVAAWLRPATGREATVDIRGTAGAVEQEDVVLRYRFAISSPPLHLRAAELVGGGAVGLGLLGGVGGGVFLVVERRRRARARQ